MLVLQLTTREITMSKRGQAIGWHAGTTNLGRVASLEAMNLMACM